MEKHKTSKDDEVCFTSTQGKKIPSEKYSQTLIKTYLKRKQLRCELNYKWAIFFPRSTFDHFQLVVTL